MIDDSANNHLVDRIWGSIDLLTYFSLAPEFPPSATGWWGVAPSHQ